MVGGTGTISTYSSLSEHHTDKLCACVRAGIFECIERRGKFLASSKILTDRTVTQKSWNDQRPRDFSEAFPEGMYNIGGTGSNLVTILMALFV